VQGKRQGCKKRQISDLGHQDLLGPSLEAALGSDTADATWREKVRCGEWQPTCAMKGLPIEDRKEKDLGLPTKARKERVAVADIPRLSLG